MTSPEPKSDTPWEDRAAWWLNGFMAWLLSAAAVGFGLLLLFRVTFRPEGLSPYANRFVVALQSVPVIVVGGGWLIRLSRTALRRIQNGSPGPS